MLCIANLQSNIYAWFVENEIPSNQDLNRYVIEKYSTDWRDISIELGMDIDTLDIIKKDHHQQNILCFQNALDKWLRLNTHNATWKSLEVALTNVNRTKLGLGPVDDVYGKECITGVAISLFYLIMHVCHLLVLYVCCNQTLYCMLIAVNLASIKVCEHVLLW